MTAFLYGVGLQWRADLRSRDMLVVFYAVPLLFFAVYGGIFTSIMPDGRETLLPMMTVFAVTMGALIGVPSAVLDMYRPEIRATYQVNGVPLWQGAMQIDIAALLHLGVLSAVVCFGSRLFYDAQMPQDMSCYVLGTVLLIAATLAVADVIGLVVRDASMASAVSIAVFLPSVLLSGIMFPADMLPDWLQGLGSIFPATWGFQLMCADKMQAADLWPLLGILAAAAAATAVLLRRLRSR